MHIRNNPSFFLTNKTGAPQGEELGLINPLSDSSFSCSDNSFISDRGRVGRGGRRVREPRRRNVKPTGKPEGQGNEQGVEVNRGSQGSDQGNGRYQNGDVVNDNIQGDVRNVIENNDRRGCTYKEFLACNLREYNGKGGAIVYTRWIEKMESVQDMSVCRDIQKVKYTAGSFVVRASHAAYTDRFHELARLVPHLVTPENKRIERYIYVLAPQIRGMVAATKPTKIQSVVLKAGVTNEAIRNGLIKKNPEKRRNGGEPIKKIIFVSTTFIPLLDIEPNDLGFGYEIEIASGQLVEIDKVFKGCKLVIDGHVFDIKLIPFGSGSFDVIIGIDWLSDHKAEINCHKKVVRISLLDGRVLRVLGEKPEEKMRQLMSAKAKEKKQEEIMVMRDFPEVFPDDLSGLPPV
ncbi:putative reverse transcriptase domain-containing protein [Tanacetum coccineum]